MKYLMKSNLFVEKYLKRFNENIDFFNQVFNEEDFLNAFEKNFEEFYSQYSQLPGSDWKIDIIKYPEYYINLYTEYFYGQINKPNECWYVNFIHSYINNVYKFFSTIEDDDFAEVINKLDKIVLGEFAKIIFEEPSIYPRYKDKIDKLIPQHLKRGGGLLWMKNESKLSQVFFVDFEKELWKNIDSYIAVVWYYIKPCNMNIEITKNKACLLKAYLDYMEVENLSSQLKKDVQDYMKNNGLERGLYQLWEYGIEKIMGKIIEIIDEKPGLYLDNKDVIDKWIEGSIDKIYQLPKHITRSTETGLLDTKIKRFDEAI